MKYFICFIVLLYISKVIAFYSITGNSHTNRILNSKLQNIKSLGFYKSKVISLLATNTNEDSFNTGSVEFSAIASIDIIHSFNGQITQPKKLWSPQDRAIVMCFRSFG